MRWLCLNYGYLRIFQAKILILFKTMESTSLMRNGTAAAGLKGKRETSRFKIDTDSSNNSSGSSSGRSETRKNWSEGGGTCCSCCLLCCACLTVFFLVMFSLAILLFLFSDAAKPIRLVVGQRLQGDDLSKHQLPGKKNVCTTFRASDVIVDIYKFTWHYCSITERWSFQLHNSCRFSKFVEYGKLHKTWRRSIARGTK